MPPPNRISAAGLRVRPLCDEDSALVDTFSSLDADLDDSLKTDALRLQSHRVARTYLASFEEQLVGYMTLLADAVMLETKERKRLALSATDHPTVPALKIARLAVASDFRAAHRGTGTALVGARSRTELEASS